MAWTDEMVEDLRRMWKEGLTTGEIGKRLGVSKNSIVGKVHRLGLSGRPSPIKKKESIAGSIAPEAVKTEKNKSQKTAKPVLKTTVPAVEKTTEKKEAPKNCNSAKEAPSNGFISLTDLDNHTCRWPLGDPKDENFHFCGKKVRIGQTYCDEHSAVAYVKANKNSKN